MLSGRLGWPSGCGAFGTESRRDNTILDREYVKLLSTGGAGLVAVRAVTFQNGLSLDQAAAWFNSAADNSRQYLGWNS